MAEAEATDPRRELAIAALLTERTIGAAAEAVGIGARTLHRWLAEDDFRREYQAASRRVLDATVGRLRAASGQALDVLVDLLGDEAGGVRCRAAVALLDLAHKVDTDELAARIDALERRGTA